MKKIFAIISLLVIMFTGSVYAETLIQGVVGHDIRCECYDCKVERMNRGVKVLQRMGDYAEKERKFYLNQNCKQYFTPHTLNLMRKYAADNNKLNNNSVLLTALGMIHGSNKSNFINEGSFDWKLALKIINLNFPNCDQSIREKYMKDLDKLYNSNLFKKYYQIAYNKNHIKNNEVTREELMIMISMSNMWKMTTLYDDVYLGNGSSDISNYIAIEHPEYKTEKVVIEYIKVLKKLYQ